MVPGSVREPRPEVQKELEGKTQCVDKEGLECHAEEFSFYPFGQWFSTFSSGELVFSKM